MPRFGITHVILGVQDLERSLRLYRDGLGLEVLENRERGCDLDASGAILRLREGSGSAAPAEIHLQTTRISSGTEDLQRFGATLLFGPQNEFDLQLRSAVLQDPDGHLLTLWRRLREDELPSEPPLGTTLPWSDEAAVLARSLLARVPLPFRDLARSGCVAEAEHLATPGTPVSRETVARAFIRSTPRLLRSRVKEPLRDHGILPDDFEADFAS